MYFDQYFIKPAFATLTSLLRTYQAIPHGCLFYISSGIWFRPVLFIQPVFSTRFNLFVFRLRDIRHLTLFSLPFGWECKGRNLFSTSK